MISPSHPRQQPYCVIVTSRRYATIEIQMAIQMAVTCSLKSATLDIIPLLSQAEFLLQWLMPAQSWIQQQ